MREPTSVRAYRVLLVTYPRSFRDRFSDSMCETFHDALSGARHEGPLAVSRLWLVVTCDALRLGLGERLNEIRGRTPPRVPQSTPNRMTGVALLASDAKYALRMLIKQRGLSANAVVALALGIGLTTTMFSIVYGSILRGLPFERPDELVHFERRSLEGDRRQMAVSYHDYVDWRAQQESFVDLGAFPGTLARSSRTSVSLS